jgi:hypothetical protein
MLARLDRREKELAREKLVLEERKARKIAELLNDVNLRIPMDNVWLFLTLFQIKTDTCVNLIVRSTRDNQLEPVRKVVKEGSAWQRSNGAIQITI